MSQSKFHKRFEYRSQWLRVSTLAQSLYWLHYHGADEYNHTSHGICAEGQKATY